MIIKVCGMRNAENIREVESIGIDMMGFICWEGSPRFVREVPAYLPRCSRVGVFVNPSLEYVKQRVGAFGFSFVQLHGTESPDFCHAVRQETGCHIIKAISVSLPEDIDITEQYECVADMFIFDTKCATKGGSGQQFDWDILRRYHDDAPFLLSGGIRPDDAERLRQWHHHNCWGFDINSRFETSPGIKDINKIKNFISTIRQHEQN